MTEINPFLFQLKLNTGLSLCYRMGPSHELDINHVKTRLKPQYFARKGSYFTESDKNEWFRTSEFTPNCDNGDILWLVNSYNPAMALWLS
jgi:hypothetical protein